MDLDALLILLQPWLRPFLAFAFFTFVRYFYRAVLLRVLHRFNDKASFTAKHPLNTEKTC